MLICVGTGKPVFTPRPCVFPWRDRGTVDHHIMNTNDLRFLQRRAHDGDDFGRRLKLFVFARSFQSATKACIALRGWFGGWSESTQLGPAPEQVIGRKTGART